MPAIPTGVMSKGPDAFRTISEVADDLDVPQHVLRFWETRFSTIRPLKRGGGRRYYRPDDVDLLKGIRQLLYGQGYTIRGVQRILKEGGSRLVQDVGRGVIEGPPTRLLADAVEDRDDGEHDVSVVGETAETLASSDPSGSEVYAPRMSGTDRQRLREALDALLDARRILAALKRE